MRRGLGQREKWRDRVSTLIRPEGRMRPDSQLVINQVNGVSTLIRPEGRMRRDTQSGPCTLTMFQPSSDPKAGCDFRHQITSIA